MRSIRKGGVFLILFCGGGGKVSDHPKDGVRQVPSCRTKALGTDELNTLAKFFDAGLMQPLTMSPTYSIADIPKAFSRSLAHGVVGKIAVVISSSGNSSEIVV